MGHRSSKLRLKAVAGVSLGDARDGGFTLIEVLVALTILSLSLGVLFGIFSQDLSRTRDTERATEARMLAQSLLAETATTAPQSYGETDGASGTGLSWQLKVSPYPQHDDQNAQLHAAVVSATITWQGSGAPRSLTLMTLRLIPKASS
jgi:general secretion pathway protein I